MALPHKQPYISMLVHTQRFENRHESGGIPTKASGAEKVETAINCSQKQICWFSRGTIGQISTDLKGKKG